jgi:hypothetical protein
MRVDPPGCAADTARAHRLQGLLDNSPSSLASPPSSAIFRPAHPSRDTHSNAHTRPRRTCAARQARQHCRACAHCCLLRSCGVGHPHRATVTTRARALTDEFTDGGLRLPFQLLKPLVGVALQVPVGLLGRDGDHLHLRALGSVGRRAGGNEGDGRRRGLRSRLQHPRNLHRRQRRLRDHSLGERLAFRLVVAEANDRPAATTHSQR